jgi:Uma2 family endonuclease
MSFEQIAAIPSQKVSTSAPARSAPKTPVTKTAAEAVTGRHQDVRLHLAVLFKTFAELTDSGLVREAPFQVRLSRTQIYEPDIVVIGGAGLERVDDIHLEGPPDLIIEVLSQDSSALDRGEKFVAYEAAGVREYWLVDPLRELTNLYQLGPDGRFDEVRPDTAGRMRSRILKGFVLDTSLLWRRVLPTTVETVEMVQSMIAQR